jgi:hypothetical protein
MLVLEDACSIGSLVASPLKMVCSNAPVWINVRPHAWPTHDDKNRLQGCFSPRRAALDANPATMHPKRGYWSEMRRKDWLSMQVILMREHSRDAFL